jgi:hypothetical protein
VSGLQCNAQGQTGNMSIRETFYVNTNLIAAITEDRFLKFPGNMIALNLSGSHYKDVHLVDRSIKIEDL